MKKKITSLLLALTLCLGLVPSAHASILIDGWTGGSGGDLGTVSAEEAAREYGISLDVDRIDFGSCFKGDRPEPITVTLTNNSDHVLSCHWVTSEEHDMFHFSHDPYGDLDPGTSAEVTISLKTSWRASGPTSVDLYLTMDPRTWAGMDSGGFGVGTVGTKLHIEDILTIDYEVKAFSDVGEGDIDWSLSATSLDLGTCDNTTRSSYAELKKTVTVTNQGSLPMTLEAELDISGCSAPLMEYRTSCDIRSNGVSYINPGQSADVVVTIRQGTWDQTGTVEGCKLLLTAYYPDSREENTLTAAIPVTAKFLTTGGHIIENKGIDRSGTVRAFDAQGSELTIEGGILVAKEGETVTFTVTPHSPANFHVSQLLVDEVNVGAVARYTLTDIRSSHTIDFALAPGAAPADQQPQPPVQPQVEPSDELPAWAEGQVKGAITQGLVPQELQGGYNLVTTRAQFCALAVRLYESAKGEITGRETFTDTDDGNVQKMAALGVVSGVGGGAFDPDGPLTREQAATILARLSNAMGKPLAGGSHPFTDGVASWADAAVGQVYQAGIMTGTGDATFSPQGEYTRMQSIVTLMRLYALVK